MLLNVGPLTIWERRRCQNIRTPCERSDRWVWSRCSIFCLFNYYLYHFIMIFIKFWQHALNYPRLSVEWLSLSARSNPLIAALVVGLGCCALCVHCYGFQQSVSGFSTTVKGAEGACRCWNMYQAAAYLGKGISIFPIGPLASYVRSYARP